MSNIGSGEILVIAGVVLCLVALFVIIAGVILYFILRNKKEEVANDSDRNP